MFYIWSFRYKQKLLARFVSDSLRERILEGVSYSRQKIKIAIILTALLFAILSLIRPKWGFHWEEVTRKGVDIIIALDVSKSMLAEDVTPNRMERAKREIFDLLNIIQGDRVGLVAFAGTSFLQSPLTLDYGAVKIFLDDLDTNLIPIPGTAIADAINKSVTSFDIKNKKSRVLILITDGEDHQGDPIAAAKLAKKAGIKVYAIGIGKNEGAPIPDKERGGFIKDSRGQMVITHLDEDTLQKIALETGGSYVRSITGDLDLERIYTDINKKVEDRELKSGKRKRFEERFQWPLFLAFFLLLFEMFFAERKKSKGKLFVLLMLVLPFISGQVKADILKSSARAAEEHYAQGEYDDALKLFLDTQLENPHDLNLQYNLASSYFKLKNYENALKIFTNLTVQGSGEMVQKSFYNLGNTSFRMGKLKEAVEFYKKAVELNPNDKDAVFNLKFVRDEIKRRIEENKKRQKDQKQNKQQNGDQKDQQKQDGQDQQKQDGEQKDKQQQEGKEGQKGDQDKEKDKKKDKNDDAGQADKKDDPAKDKKEEEKKAAAAGKEDKPDDNKKDEKKQENASAGKADSGAKKDDKKMSNAEAQRWLNSLKDGRKEYLKRKMKGQKNYSVEKGW